MRTGFGHTSVPFGVTQEQARQEMHECLRLFPSRFLFCRALLSTTCVSPEKGMHMHVHELACFRSSTQRLNNASRYHPTAANLHVVSVNGCSLATSTSTAVSSQWRPAASSPRQPVIHQLLLQRRFDSESRRLPWPKLVAQLTKWILLTKQRADHCHPAVRVCRRAAGRAPNRSKPSCNTCSLALSILL